MPNTAILCVDDESVVLNSLKMQLRNAFQDRFLYEIAESADEAMELLDEFAAQDIRVLCVVSDWLMPGTRGDAFLIQVHQKFPDMIKVMLTGQADESAIARTIAQANLYRCLHKPWNRDELIATIESGIASLRQDE
ncbi:MAG: response regulator [Oculatellaceae cyanobacterium Prado106]|jgi:DNA-binding NtrC family response regulator|nr:response regulator [Oculatellaceae cyanobacterium Prado106]